MFHKKIAEAIQQENFHQNDAAHRSAGLRLVSRNETAQKHSTTLPELINISARRCSAFFAEAAVLVLVFGILDFFIQRGRMEMAWVAGALMISVALLGASVATEFSARRWLGAQP